MIINGYSFLIGFILGGVVFAYFIAYASHSAKEGQTITYVNRTPERANKAALYVIDGNKVRRYDREVC